MLESGNPYANSLWVNYWEGLNIEREASSASTRNAQDNTVAVTTDLEVEGSVVAVAADANSSYDYYLFKVKSDGVEELAEEVTDDYGSIYTSGQEVFGGHFYL